MLDSQSESMEDSIEEALKFVVQQISQTYTLVSRQKWFC